MDGVIADWNKQFCVISGLDHSEVIKNWKPGITDISDQLGISKSQMWGRIGANKDFWMDIPVFPYAHEMVDYLRSKYEVRICSSPSSDPLCVAHKLEWLNKNKFKFGKKTHINHEKWPLAGPGRLLIDDMDKNIEKWSNPPEPWAVAGPTLLFPQVWNSAGEYSGCKLQLIKDLL